MKLRDTGQIGPWLRPDRLYFEAHPEARWYVRDRFPQEFQPAPHVAHDDEGTHMIRAQLEALLSHPSAPAGAVVAALVIRLEGGSRGRVPVARVGDRIYWPGNRGGLRTVDPETLITAMTDVEVVEERPGDACPVCQRAYFTGDVTLVFEGGGEACAMCVFGKRCPGRRIAATTIYISDADGPESTWSPETRKRFAAAQQLVAELQQSARRKR